MRIEAVDFFYLAMPEITDAASMPIFAVAISRSSENARSLMNKDMVKPIPARLAAPKRFGHVTFWGSAPQPLFTASQLIPKMPSGLPATRLAMMPSETG